MAKPIQTWKERIINLKANQIHELIFSQSVNTAIIRNPSGSHMIYLGLDRTLDVGSHESVASFDGWGMLTRPFNFDRIYLLATNDINNVKIVESYVENPAVLLPSLLQSSGSVAAQVAVTASVGLKATDLSLDGTKKLNVNVASSDALKATDLNLDASKNLNTNIISTPALKTSDVAINESKHLAVEVKSTPYSPKLDNLDNLDLTLTALKDALLAVYEPKSVYNQSTAQALTTVLDTGQFGGRSQVEIWVKSSASAIFEVFGSRDGTNWRKIEEISLSGAGEKHLGYLNAYRHLKVATTAENDNEIEIVTSR